MSTASEVSPDDPHGVADAFRRAAGGATVRVVRDGRAIAAIVPAGQPETDAEERDRRGREIERQAALRGGGGPTLEDFRRIYRSQGWDWPGDESVARTHLVADAS